LPIPIRVRIPETVESGHREQFGDFGPAKRNRRNAAIASIRSSEVRLATSSALQSDQQPAL
jgi:hypothetical protein